MTVTDKNDIFLHAMVRGILTNRITPVLCVNRILDLTLNAEEEKEMFSAFDSLLRVKNITMANLVKRAYEEAASRKEQLS